MKSVEEYLYYQESEDYAYLKFVSCTYYKSRQRLVVRYIYAEEIADRLPVLKRRLEELFIKQVGLPIKYEFCYKKVYIDNLVLQLEILNFLRQKFAALAGNIKDDQVQVVLDHNTWQINLFLAPSLIEFLTHSKQWQKFQSELQDRNFFEFEFYLNPVC